MESIKSLMLPLLLFVLLESCNTNVTNDFSMETKEILLTEGAYSVLSPNGKYIAFQKDNNLYLMDRDGGNIRLVKSKVYDQHVWAPNSLQLLYFSRVDGNLYCIASDGSNDKLLGDSGHKPRIASWSPDGKKIAFVAGSVKAILYTMDMEGKNIQQVSNILSSVNPLQSPKWSKDGNRILFSAGFESDRDIYLVNVDGSNLVRIKEDSLFEENACLTSDGTKVFFSGEDVIRDFYCINANGSGIQNLTKNLNLVLNTPVLSPDERKIAFKGYSRGDALYTISSSGMDLKMIADSVSVGNISWAPDCKSLIFDATKIGNSGKSYMGIFSVDISK